MYCCWVNSFREMSGLCSSQKPRRSRNKYYCFIIRKRERANLLCFCTKFWTKNIFISRNCGILFQTLCNYNLSVCHGLHLKKSVVWKWKRGKLKPGILALMSQNQGRRSAVYFPESTLRPGICEKKNQVGMDGNNQTSQNSWPPSRMQISPI